MKSFKELFLANTHNQLMSGPSVSISDSNNTHTLQLRFDSKDRILEANFTGKANGWLSSMCEFLPGLTLAEASQLDQSYWKTIFKNDQSFWDFQNESSHTVFFPPLELLKASLDVYRGRDYLYQESSHLICRCFGVRESDVLNYLKEVKEPTLEDLSAKTKAGMGCRSCVSQLKRWMTISTGNKDRYYKEQTHANWLILIDDQLKTFPEASELKMSVESFKKSQVIIAYEKEVSQSEEEQVGKRLQTFLSVLDPDLGFFLRRSRQR